MRLAGIVAGLGLCVLLSALPAVAQDFPTRAVRIIVGYSAGGGNDIAARLIAAKLSEILGHPVIVENKPGAQSIIAAEFVAKAPPDGYTILMGPTGTMAMNPATHAKLPYSSLHDVVPISLIGSFPLIVAVNAALPVRSVKELVEYAKARPNEVNYAASAASFQLATELFKQRTGTQFAYIPYKGSGDSVKALIAGEVTMTIVDPLPVIGSLKSGAVRGLAVTSTQRHPAWPDMPTLAEAGVPDIDVALWMALFAPAGTPAGVVSKLQAAVARVVDLADVRQRFTQLGVDAMSSTSEALRVRLATDIEKWRAVAKAGNIKSD